MFDVSLLSQLREGNREAFNSLFRHYYPRVMAYVAAMVEQEVAEDVVQDVFLHVWENRKKLYAGEGFHSYLFQAAYTRCIDYYRKTQSADKYNLHMESAYLEEYNALLRSDASVLEEIYSNVSRGSHAGKCADGLGNFGFKRRNKKRVWLMNGG